MSDQEQPDWDAELEELVKDVEVEAASEAPAPADASAAGSDDQPATGRPEAEDQDLVELLKERTADLQRLQAEYVNYKRRVDRDRDLARQRGIETVLADMLPILDGVEAANAHGELTAGAKMIADEIEKLAVTYGLVAFGQEGDAFDPHIHDALMHIDKAGYPVTSVAQVFQKGYAIGDRVIRPARVGVADADEAVAADPQANQPGDGLAAGGSAAPVSPAGSEETPSAGDEATGENEAPGQ